MDGRVEPLGHLELFPAARRDLLFLEDGEDLVVDEAPLPHPREGQEVLRAELLELVLRAGLLVDLPVGVPDVEERQKVRVGVLEEGVLRVGRRGLVGRALARVPDAQGRGDDRDLPQTALLRGLEEHARDPGVERHRRHAPAERGQREIASLARDGPQLEERVEPVLDGPGVGHVHERKVRRDSRA